MKSGIYAIVNTTNDKIYIGSAVNFKYRWKAHIYRLTANTHHNLYLQNAWNKQTGLGFIFSIIETCDINSLIEREQYWLDTLTPVYNIRKKADTNLGVRHRPEAKLKLSLFRMGKPSPNKGKSLSLEQRQAIAKSKRSPEWSCPEGWYCKCDNCMKAKRLKQHTYNAKAKQRKLNAAVI